MRLLILILQDELLNKNELEEYKNSDPIEIVREQILKKKMRNLKKT